MWYWLFQITDKQDFNTEGVSVIYERLKNNEGNITYWVVIFFKY